MTDLDCAKLHLPGHSLALCRGGTVLTDDARGIAPMMNFLSAGRDLHGFSAADLVVGRAAALLFVLAGITSVYAATLSRGGMDVLAANGIPVEYGTITDSIRNRAGTGNCPMEQAVSGTDDPETAYRRIGDRLAAMRADR